MTKTLYHGSIYDFNVVDLRKCRALNDFGKGFYLTANKRHADSIAKRNLRKTKGSVAYRHYFLFDDRSLLRLRVKEFKEPDLEWIKFVVFNRTHNAWHSRYDIIIGPTADARTVELIQQFVAFYGNNPSNDAYRRLIIDINPNALPRQYCFVTRRAISTLYYTGREELLK